MKKFSLLLLILVISLANFVGCDNLMSIVETDKSASNLDELMQALQSGDVVNLKDDIYVPNEADKQIVVTKDFVINGNGHKIYCQFEDGAYTYNAPISVMNDAVLTLNDVNVESSIYCVNVGKASLHSRGYLVVHGGNFVGDTTCVQVQLGTAFIYDGNFTVVPYEGSYRYTLNLIDSSYTANTANFVVKGGNFTEYDPSQSASENPIANFVAQGYTVTSAQNDQGVTTYSVVKQTDNQ